MSRCWIYGKCWFPWERPVAVLALGEVALGWWWEPGGALREPLGLSCGGVMGGRVCMGCAASLWDCRCLGQVGDALCAQHRQPQSTLIPLSLHQGLLWASKKFCTSAGRPLSILKQRGSLGDRPISRTQSHPANEAAHLIPPVGLPSKLACR